MTHPSGFNIGGVKHLVNDVTIITRMEDDLVAKAKLAMAAHELDEFVHGVFSLDDLETKMGSELCNKIGVGVGYMRCEPTALVTNPKSPVAADRGTTARMLDFFFGIILAVPTSPQCDERSTATTVLTAMRLNIMGSRISEDVQSRGWAFVSEAPDITASSDTMLYYAQVWRAAIPSTGQF